MSQDTRDLFELSLQDSELAGAEAQGDTLVLRLAAAHVQRPQSRQHGYVRHLELWCLQARWEGTLAEAIGRIREAQASMDGALLRLHAPGRATGEVRLSLSLGFGAVLVVHAAAVEARFAGTPGFRESLAC